MLIDIHTHVVPERFPADPTPGETSRWPCLCVRDDRTHVIEFGGKPFRELDARSWSIRRRLEDMDRDGVDAQALSPMPELLSYWLPIQHALDLGRYVNHVIADMVARAPARFHGLATVPLQDVARATVELERVKGDGFAGIEIGSNINGVFLGDRGFDEFYAEAERLDLAVFIHALHPVGSERLQAFPDLIPYAAFPVDTGLAAMTLIRAGTLERFPRLRFGFSHGGGAIVPLAQRLEHGWRQSEGFAGTVAMSPREQARRFFYDSLVYDVSYLDYLATQFAPGQICAGTDYPYAIRQEGLARFLDESSVCSNGATAAAAGRFLGLVNDNADTLRSVD